MFLETLRLRLHPLSAEQMRFLIEGTGTFDAPFDLPDESVLREIFRKYASEISPAWLEKLRASTGVDPWQHGFAVVHRELGQMIGTVSFKGAPDVAGVVEIAYGVFPAHEGRGYTTEATAELVKFAFADDRVRIVRAHTLKTSVASMRILEKCGFTNVGEVVEPEDGLVVRWERSR
jgi:RimJ/RimL family protein N-acetyltransferase